MANVFIVENDLTDYTRVSAWLEAKSHEVYPKKQDFNRLRSALSKTYSDGNSLETIKEGRESITAILGVVVIDLFIVDYELKKDAGHLVNAFAFCDDFIDPKQTFIIVTAMNDHKTINEINAFCKPPSDFLCKDARDLAVYKKRLLTRVQELLPPSGIQFQEGDL